MGNILDIRQQHHNSAKYPNQKIAIIEIEGYAYQVPFIQEDNVFVLKTVYPSRKATAFYLKNRGKNDE